MTLEELSNSINPLRKAGEILGKLESQDKTSADVERIVSGEDQISYGFYSGTLGTEIGISEETLPESFLEGYRAGMQNASESIRYTDIADTRYEDLDISYTRGD